MAALNGHNASGAPKPVERVLSRVQMEHEADEEARAILGVASRVEAFRMLDAGELDGTMAEVEFRMLRHLMGSTAR
jgi:hypothetical protein